MREIGFALFLGISAFAFTGDLGWLFHSRADLLEPLQLGSHLASEALVRGGGSACERESRCDKLTGCIAPSPPPGPILRVLPEGGEYDRYVRGLRAFQACRERVLLSMKPQRSSVQLVGFGQLRLEEAHSQAPCNVGMVISSGSRLQREATSSRDSGTRPVLSSGRSQMETARTVRRRRLASKWKATLSS